MQRPFRQVNVFSQAPLGGNPVAVVLDGQGLRDEEMQAFARWTNLSETTFVLPPTDPEASYRVRIFTPAEELPFAGHPTLGTCHAWLETQEYPPGETDIIQECGAGLVPLRSGPTGLAFAAPPRRRSGPIDAGTLDELVDVLGIGAEEVVAAEWVDNGPGWAAVLLDDVARVLALRPGPCEHKVGVVAPYPQGSPEAFEVRAFFTVGGRALEDPVTGSLNASLGQWLLESGRARAPYVARQGTVLGRDGQVHIAIDDDQQVWVGGVTTTLVEGLVDL
jgi:PhzF family phenazine biosynthesis protein